MDVKTALGPVTVLQHLPADELKKQHPSATFLEGLGFGNPTYAATWYNWGYNSPYLFQDAFFSLCGAILSLVCVPALFVRWMYSLMGKELAHQMSQVLRMIVIGTLRGLVLLVVSPFYDSWKWVTRRLRPTQKAVILAIDMQNDFFSGSLAVPLATQIIPVLKNLLKSRNEGTLYFASQDWHPEAHGSFAENLHAVPFSETTLNGLVQTAWPTHCVQGTYGAQFIEQMPLADVVIQKGQDILNDSYSAVADQGIPPKKTKLLSHLNAEGIQRLFICGVATDFCVAATVRDLCQHGFDVIVIEDGCKGVYSGLLEEAKQQADLKIKHELKQMGATFMSAEQAIATYPQHFITSPIYK